MNESKSSGDKEFITMSININFPIKAWLVFINMMMQYYRFKCRNVSRIYIKKEKKS